MEPIPCHNTQWYVYNNKEKMDSSMECRYIHVYDFIKMLDSMRSHEQITFMDTVICAIDVHISTNYDVHMFLETPLGTGVVYGWYYVWGI